MLNCVHHVASVKITLSVDAFYPSSFLFSSQLEDWRGFHLAGVVAKSFVNESTPDQVQAKKREIMLCNELISEDRLIQ